MGRLKGRKATSSVDRNYLREGVHKVAFKELRWVPLNQNNAASTFDGCIFLFSVVESTAHKSGEEVSRALNLFGSSGLNSRYQLGEFDKILRALHGTLGAPFPADGTSDAELDEARAKIEDSPEDTNETFEGTEIIIRSTPSKGKDGSVKLDKNGQPYLSHSYTAVLDKNS